MDHSCSGERNTAVAAWAIASNGDVLIRHGVCSLNPRGDAWEHITSDQPLVGISVGPTGQVWTVARNGMVFFRYGISRQNPCGDAWQQVEAPAGVTFKAISVGRAGIWALDNQQRLAVRKEISRTFPEGSHWQFLPNAANVPPHTDQHCGFRSVSVGSEVWAISLNGIICRRCGITEENPAGVGWNLGIAVCNLNIGLVEFIIKKKYPLHFRANGKMSLSKDICDGVEYFICAFLFTYGRSCLLYLFIFTSLYVTMPTLFPKYMKIRCFLFKLFETYYLHIFIYNL